MVSADRCDRCGSFVADPPIVVYGRPYCSECRLHVLGDPHLERAWFMRRLVVLVVLFALLALTWWLLPS